MRIETGRYERERRDGKWQNLPEEKRTCMACGKDEVENELHFLLKCQKYTQPRVILRYQIEKLGGTYTENHEMLSQLLSKKAYIGITADYLQYAIELRNKRENLNPV